MAFGQIHASDFMTSQIQEAVKTYTVYDGSNRPQYFYVAMVDTVHGGQCQLTTYTYDGASTRVQKSKESLATWDSAWDI